MRTYKLQKRHGLNGRQKLQERSEFLLQRCARAERLNTLCIDEKFFTLHLSLSFQNDSELAKNCQKASENGIIVERTSHSRYPMVWGGVCAIGKTPLVFIDPGLKINANF